MKQKAVFLFFCTIFVAGSVFSQKINPVTNNLLLVPVKQKPFSPFFFSVNKDSVSQSQKQFLPADFYVTRLGFFCKEEIKFQKLTKIPFRFRLGSVEECDRMEGKLKN
jgi:hypothetical protein